MGGYVKDMYRLPMCLPWWFLRNSVIYPWFRLVVPYNSDGLAEKVGLAYYCTASLLGQEWSDVEGIVLGET